MPSSELRCPASASRSSAERGDKRSISRNTSVFPTPVEPRSTIVRGNVARAISPFTQAR
jgi:hypothetical protein